MNTTTAKSGLLVAALTPAMPAGLSGSTPCKRCKA